MTQLMDLFRGEPLSVTIRRVMEGLKAPKDSGEYKYARFAMTRIILPPGISFLCSVLLLAFAMFAAAIPPAPSEKTFEVTAIEAEKVDTKEIKPEEEQPQPPPPEDIVVNRPDLAPGPVSQILTPGPASEYSSGDSPNDTKPGVGGDLDVPMVPYAAVMTKSPVIIRGLYGNRTKGGREAAGKAYGGGGAGFGATEGAVLRALRWLKKYQKDDGSWTGECGGVPKAGKGSHGEAGAYGGKASPDAYTGLALLCFLAHGETPASEEFGQTVEKAIRWLVDHQGADGHFAKSGSDLGYGHPIATYALCEAYGMTKVPTLQFAAEKAINYIIKGQHESGGWDYDCNKAGTRDDTSVTSWCAQALKAAKMAGLSNKDLDQTMKKAIKGLQQNYNSNCNAFNYSNCQNLFGNNLTSAAVLSLQLLGGAKEKEARSGMAWLNANATCNWEKPWGYASIYYWYYTTQAMFHTGGDSWRNWNKQFSFEVVKHQNVIKCGIKDAHGNDVDIGYWDPANPDEFCHSLVYNTTLCCLMLEVYYRYLPTFQMPKDGVAVDGPAPADGVASAKDGAGKADKVEKEQVKIDIQM